MHHDRMMDGRKTALVDGRLLTWTMNDPQACAYDPHAVRDDLPGAIEPLVVLLRTGTPAVQLQVEIQLTSGERFGWAWRGS